MSACSLELFHGGDGYLVRTTHPNARIVEARWKTQRGRGKAGLRCDRHKKC